MTHMDDKNLAPIGESREFGAEAKDDDRHAFDDFEPLRETLEAILAGMKLTPPEKLRS